MALSNLLAIGRTVEAHLPFEQYVSAALRPELGDWRDPFTFPTEPFLDVAARTDFYVARGFDRSLTEFTPDAFDEGLQAANLKTGETAEEDTDEDGLALARAAFGMLQHFEVTVRKFIESVMSKAFGHDWMKRQLPPKMLDAWVTKKENAVKDGQPEQPLISYADFTDYKAIIERRDNWEMVFKPIFGRAEDVRESFQRLFPVRIAATHARIVTTDDELLLRVETRRIFKAIETLS